MNKFDKVKSIFLKDLNWKIFSVVVAVFLWVMVINVKNPVETRKYTVPLNIRSEEFLAEEGYYVTNLEEIEGTPVTITVRGERSSLDTLSKLRDSISAYVNLSKSSINADAGTATCSIETSLPIGSRDSLEIVSQNILNVVFGIEESSSREMAIRVILPDDMKNTRMASNITVEPEMVTITGPKSYVDSVRRVCVYYNSDNPSLNKNRAVYAYNATGDEVENIELDITKADIIVPEKEKVDVEFSANYTGTPAEGYAVTSVVVDDGGKEFFTYGSDLSKAVINLPDIDIEGKSGTVKEEFDITELIPERMELLKPEDPYVEVSVNIMKSDGTSDKEEVPQIELQSLNERHRIFSE